MSSRTNQDEPEVAGDDAMMEDAPASQQGDETEGAPSVIEEIEEGRVFMLAGSTPTAASFEFREEGHTLGNALRFIIMKNPEVEFCAYAIPHPSEARMNVRIQTYEGTTAVDALRKGLKDLQELCDVVVEKYWIARDTVEKTPAPSKKQLRPDGEPILYTE